MSRIVRVTTPSRLHFGLLRFEQAEGPSFGGLGMMINQPQVMVEITRSDDWSAEGAAADRALIFAQQAMQACGPADKHRLHVRVINMPPQHTGLGTGTQLALAIAAGVRTACGLPQAPLADLVASVHRGKRSAIGSHGFYGGGLILESGRSDVDALGKLQQRVDMPEDWPIVLITSQEEQGRHGRQESDAFGQLDSVPTKITDQLLRLALDEILPAAQRKDAETFDHAIHDYGKLAGNCFAKVQGGPLASPAIARRVEILRSINIPGVGQSSWGPTIFVMVRNEAPEALVAELTPRPEFANCTFTVTAPDNCGAEIATL